MINVYFYTEFWKYIGTKYIYIINSNSELLDICKMLVIQLLKSNSFKQCTST